MTDQPRVPVEAAVTEIVERKSRFIGYALPLRSPDTVSAEIRRIRDLHTGCSHVVSAWRIGSRGDVFGYSDDGEPKGTAGRPSYEVLRGSGITDVLVAVVRFFGGTLLGTGGLARAYALTTRNVLDIVRTEPLLVWRDFSIRVPYGLYEQTKACLSRRGGVVREEAFTENVAIAGSVPDACFEACRKDLLDLSAGAVDLGEE